MGREDIVQGGRGRGQLVAELVVDDEIEYPEV